jgi:hypothetical protein
MLLKRIEIRNVRKIRQADIEFHGPGTQIIQGLNESGKTSLAQSIAITFGGSKEFVTGMVSHGQEQAEIIAYTDNELKIRTVISGGVKQTVYEKDSTTGKYSAVSGGVRAFIDSMRSGLEMPWALRNMTDAQIIEILKNRAGITDAIAKIDFAVKNKETARTDTGRDIKRFGTLAPVGEAKHPKPIDEIKKERERTQKYQKEYADAQSAAQEAVRHALTSCYTFEELESLVSLIKTEVENGREKLIGYKDYTAKSITSMKQHVESLDKQIADWYEKEQTAKNYDEYLVKKTELDKLNADYAALTAEIETLRETRKKTLADMKLGVDGLVIGEDNFLYHNGALRGITDTNKESNWSTAESVKVFFSIGAIFAGNLKVLVVDNAESLDEKTTGAISDWAESSKFLVILLKVASIPDELEDGIIYIREGEVLKK